MKTPRFKLILLAGVVQAGVHSIQLLALLTGFRRQCLRDGRKVATLQRSL